ncbi:unnamed protein product, partial [marine sediment metagenome]
MGMAQGREFIPANILVIGDPHAKKSNVPEIDSLTKKIKAEAIARKVHAIVILGDLANDFAKI